MSAVNFRRSRVRVLVAVLVWGSAAVSSSLFGPAPAVQTVEGGPIPASTPNDYGNPLPPNSSSGGLQTSSSSGLQSVPSNNTSVPSANFYGTNDAATTGAHERGVAGSGLPRENVSVVDTKTLPSSKSDGKFSSSLMEAGLKSASDAKSSAATQKGATKSQASKEKLTLSSKAPEKTSSSTDASASAKTQTSPSTTDKH
jgi:hypothetical protein